MNHPGCGGIPIDETKTGHIFRNAPGHLPDDTPANRKLLTDTANAPANFLGTDKRGNDWYARTLDDGRQVWTSSRGGQIGNGGINEIPRAFNPLTGLSAPIKPNKKK